MTMYFSFAISDSMFSSDCSVVRRSIDPEYVKVVKDMLCGDYVSALNPSHIPTIKAAKERFDLDLKVPEKAPIVELKIGDCLIVMSVRGLPRLGGDRHEYTADEIAKATFAFSAWFVEKIPNP